MLSRKQQKELVPHGYGKIIADKAGVSPKVVSEYLNDKINHTGVELATLEVLAELSKERKAKDRRRKALLKQIAV